MHPQQQNQYDFFMNPQQPKRSGLNFGNSLTARIAIFLGGLTLLIIVVVTAFSFIGKGNEEQTQRLVGIAQSQAELIRISSLAADKAKTAETKNLALNTKLSTESSQQEVRKVLAGRGINNKTLNKQIAASKNVKTDAAFEQAVKNNRFDEVFQQTINTEITKYQNKLQAAYEEGNKTEKTILSDAFRNTEKLTNKQAAQN